MAATVGPICHFPVPRLVNEDVLRVSILAHTEVEIRLHLQARPVRQRIPRVLDELAAARLVLRQRAGVNGGQQVDNE
ncbi:MAG TPA: hypothetical protein VL086_01260 [Candidatus Nitrosotalea sp.]|nr:hypothetical protein [Candidatus Nitrosotalea sp.]